MPLAGLTACDHHVKEDERGKPALIVVPVSLQRLPQPTGHIASLRRRGQVFDLSGTHLPICRLSQTRLW